jgi:hypothetical protein
MDRNGDGEVSIDELITAVNHALDGCPDSSTVAALIDVRGPRGVWVGMTDGKGASS